MEPVTGQSWQRVRRPLTRLTAAATAAHVFFELFAGVGMPLASLLGLAPAAAAALWAGSTAPVWRVAVIPSGSVDRPLMVVNVMCLAAVVAHLTAWPRRRTRFGLPWLDDCEGLGPELMPIYIPSSTFPLWLAWRQR
jgi:hypothetical protein